LTPRLLSNDHILADSSGMLSTCLATLSNSTVPADSSKDMKCKRLEVQEVRRMIRMVLVFEELVAARGGWKWYVLPLLII
jgi:hypothetical protein